MKIAASALSDRGLKRDGNEDQYLIDESLGLHMVCDGMGGHAAGEVAAERAIEFTAEYIASRAEDVEPAVEKPDGYFRILKLAEEAVHGASQKVHQLARSSPEYAGMGTTLTMLVILGEKAIIAHVDDSRLYLMRAGEIHQLTVGHTSANEMFLAGELTKEQAAKSRYQHVLTRSIGPHESVAVDTLLFDLLPGDRNLLCSDVLSNYFPDSSVVAALLAKPQNVSQPRPLIESKLVESDCFGQATLNAPAGSPASLVANEASRVLLIDRRSFTRLTSAFRGSAICYSGICAGT